jgi:predicted ATPase/DNA-binding XRE family transcriptional regulator
MTVENGERLTATPASDFGRVLRRYRLAAGLSQEGLAERARMSINGISALERGYRRVPRFETLRLLAAALALNDEQQREFVAAAAKSGTARGGGSLTVGPWTTTGALMLPIALTSFVGRHTELIEIAAMMRDRRMITLTGPGGIGKTRLAMQAATAFGARENAILCLVELAPVKDGSLVASAIASALGVREVPNRDLLETLCAHLKDKVTLLILDNCEHVIERAASVAKYLLQNCPTLRVLATSRERLRAAGEHAFRIGPLDASDAVALFVDRARAVAPRFALRAETGPVIEKICRSVDHVPLAIELVAAQLEAFSAEGLAAKLGNQLPLLNSGERTAEPRQQSMRRTIDWSYGLLSAPAQRAFEHLSIFAGGCTLDMATQVCAGEVAAERDVPDLMKALIDRSILIVGLEGPLPRYRLLEPFRQYAREQLVARGEDRVAARRHAIACLKLSEWINEAVESEPVSIWLRRAFDEQHNMRAALDWSLRDRHDVLVGQQLTAKVAFTCLPFSERRRWLTLSLDAVTEKTPRRVVASLKVAKAFVTASLFDTNTSLDSADDALQSDRDLSALDIVRAKWARGHALVHLGRRAEAQQTLEEAVDKARRLGRRARCSLAVVLKHLASALENDLRLSRSYIDDALQIHRELGMSDAQPLTALSVCEARAGDLGMAIKHSLEALTVAPAGSYERLVALNWHSRFLLESEQWTDVEKVSRELLLLSREQNIDVQIAWTLDLLAAVSVLRPRDRSQSSRKLCANCAKVLGFVDARLRALHSFRDFIEQPQYERVIEKLSHELGRDALSELMFAGATLTEGQAVELVRR